MKYCATIGLALIAAIVALAYHQFQLFVAPAKLPDYDLNAYWGDGSPEDFKPNNQTQLMELRYRTEPIDRLREQLNHTILVQPPLAGTNFELGFNTGFLQDFVTYWRDEYLKYWPSREVVFNRMPHFRTNIQGLNLHYIHTRASYDVHNKTVLPIMLLHGWPGSVREFYDLTALLADPDRNETDVVFEVVAPSLPGFGWSQAPQRRGMGVAEMAVVMRNLMVRLGYERFYVHGGDWGARIGAAMATLFPQQVIGFHSNTCAVLTPLALLKGVVAEWRPHWFVSKANRDFHFPAGEKLVQVLAELGYAHLQATRPETIGTVLSQNPIGLAVYIYEKFATWTHSAHRALPDGGWSGLDEEYRDAILDNIMVYQLTHTITTSARLYAEATTADKLAERLDSIPTAVPTGCARFRQDLMHALDWQLQDKYTNLVHSTYYREGGHFAAMERPKAVYKDFAKFLRKLQKRGVWQ